MNQLQIMNEAKKPFKEISQLLFFGWEKDAPAELLKTGLD